MKFNFTHNGLEGVLSRSFWTGRDKLFINGTEVQKTGKEWVKNDLHIEVKAEHIFFPKLSINGEEVKLVKFQKWEWFFVLLPGIFIVMGGAVPALVGAVGIYLNFSIFITKEISPVLKILSSLGYLILGFVSLFALAIMLRS